MKSILLTLVLMASTAGAQVASSRSEQIKKALESQEACQNFVRIDESSIYLGFGYYRQAFENPRSPQPGFLRVVSIENPNQVVDLKTSDSAIGVQAVGSLLYVLTYSGLEAWDSKTATRIATYPTTDRDETSLDYLQHASSLAKYKDTLIISHGRLGVSFFDLKTLKITKTIDLVQKQAPLESEAVDVAVEGQFAYVLMDSFSLVERGTPAFQGIVKIDLETQTVVAEMSDMGPGSDSLVMDQKTAIVSFWGVPLWKYNTADLVGKKMPKPELRIWKYPVFGHPIGKPAMDDKYYYTCFRKMSVNGNQPNVVRPLALDRRVLMLD